MDIPVTSSTVGASPLITTLRQMRPDDVETTIEALPPTTSTVPALRPRAHRGGKSILLKDAFPSGFHISRNNPQEGYQLHVHIPRPTESNEDVCVRRPVFPPAGLNEGCMMRGKKASGMTPWGSPGGRRLLTVTQVAIGSRVVPDAIGSELVQFGPGIPCGPPEQSSPRRLDRRIRMLESDTNLSCINLDGSALLEKEKIHVATSAGAESLQKSNSRIRSIAHEPMRWRLWADFAAMVNLPGRASQLLTQRTSSGLKEERFLGTPCTKEMCLVAPSTERPTAEARVGAAKRSFQGYNKKRGGRGRGEGQDQASACEGCDSKGPRQQPEDSRPEIGVKILRRKSGSRYYQKKSLTDLLAAGLAGIPQDKESGRTGDTGTAVKRDKDNSDRESFTLLQGESDFSLESVTALEAPTTVSSVSLSSLDTERYYGGNISADATEILRSYIEPRNISLEGANANSPGNPDFPRTDAEEAFKLPTSLYTPSRPFSKEFDSLLEHLPAPRATKTLCNARPLENLSRCYISTREDIILAVVRKDDLLGCENDLEIRRLKDAAYPIRITANMNLKQGIRAIVSSGVLSAEGVGGEEQAVVSATRSRGARWNSSRTWVLKYFNWRTGTWNAVCNENDWNVLLATPSRPAGRREGACNGGRVSFRSSGHKLHRADFLVTVTSAPLASRSPRIQRRKMRELAWFSPCSAKTFTVTRANAAARNDRLCWPRASPVTTGTLASQQVRSRKLGEMRDPPCSPPPTKANVLPAGVPGVISFEEKNTVDVDRRLAGRKGVRTRRGPGPGAALWTSATSYSDGKDPDFYPKKAKVRRLVKRLEARLRLKSKLGAGYVPAVTAQKTGTETPYSRELAKWGYDKILGSSQAAVTSGPIC